MKEVSRTAIGAGRLVTRRDWSFSRKSILCPSPECTPRESKGLHIRDLVLGRITVYDQGDIHKLLLADKLLKLRQWNSARMGSGGNSDERVVPAYAGWVYRVGTSSLGFQFCRPRFLVIKSKYVTMFKSNPNESPRPIRWYPLFLCLFSESYETLSSLACQCSLHLHCAIQ